MSLAGTSDAPSMVPTPIHRCRTQPLGESGRPPAPLALHSGSTTAALVCHGKESGILTRCPNGHPAPTEASFCPECGRKIDVSVDEDPATQPNSPRPAVETHGEEGGRSSKFWASWRTNAPLAAALVVCTVGLVGFMVLRNGENPPVDLDEFEVEVAKFVPNVECMQFDPGYSDADRLPAGSFSAVNPFPLVNCNSEGVSITGHLAPSHDLALALVADHSGRLDGSNACLMLDEPSTGTRMVVDRWVIGLMGADAPAQLEELKAAWGGSTYWLPRDSIDGMSDAEFEAISNESAQAMWNTLC